MCPTQKNDTLNPFREAEHSGWERLAGGYDNYFQDLVTQTIDALLDEAGVSAGIRVLDVCCGPGYVSERARQRRAVPVGVDFSAQMVTLAKRRHPDLEFEVGDAEALDQPDGSFDAVAMNFGLHHLAQPERAIAEAARILRPGGRFAFTVWAPPGDNVGHRIIFDAIERHGIHDLKLPVGPPMFLFSDPGECRKAFGAAGLVDPNVRTVPLLWKLPPPYGVFDAYRAGGVRPAIILGAQSPEALHQIREAVRVASASFARRGRLEIPMAAVLASARRNGSPP